MMREEPELVLHSAHSSELPDVQCMGLYAVLGEYDFITILEAPDNEAAARFSKQQGNVFHCFSSLRTGIVGEKGFTGLQILGHLPP